MESFIRIIGTLDTHNKSPITIGITDTATISCRFPCKFVTNIRIYFIVMKIKGLLTMDEETIIFFPFKKNTFHNNATLAVWRWRSMVVHYFHLLQQRIFFKKMFKIIKIEFNISIIHLY